MAGYGDRREQPQWTRDGRELLYLDRTSHLASARVETTGTFSIHASTQVLESLYASGNGPWSYDISADGQRFLMLKDLSASTATTPASIVIVLNWLQELKQRLPLR